MRTGEGAGATAVEHVCQSGHMQITNEFQLSIPQGYSREQPEMDLLFAIYLM